jgi:predicted RNA-binding Zn-ribbon protein involved in translation (DUF1610 family)
VSGQDGGGQDTQPAGERQVPFYCPYCGDEDLRPAGPAGGSWRCGACQRAFELRFAGVVRAGAAGATGAAGAGLPAGGGQP